MMALLLDENSTELTGLDKKWIKSRLPKSLKYEIFMDLRRQCLKEDLISILSAKRDEDYAYSLPNDTYDKIINIYIDHQDNSIPANQTWEDAISMVLDD